MGQYGNQPDFGTIVTTGDDVGSGYFSPSAIYVGKTTDGNAASIVVLPAGNEDTIEITGIPQGTFLPIVVIKLISVTNMNKGNILFYR
jgi:hypothetical protein